MEIEPLRPHPQPKGRELLYSLLGVSTLALTFFILDLTLKPQLHSSGADLIEAIQTSRTEGGDVLMYVLSVFCFSIVLIVPVYDYVFNDPVQGFKGIILATHVVYFTNLLKLLYSDPRPYWDYEDVEGVQCSDGWGNPSGHASLSMAVLGYYSLIVTSQKGRGVVVWSACAVFIAFIGLERQYLGVHFYSQLLLGWLLGLSVAFAYFYWDWLPSKLYNASLGISASIYFWVGHVVLCSGIALLIFYLRNPYWDSDWTDNIDDDCNNSISENSAKTKSVIEAANICMAAGFAISLNLCEGFARGNWLLTANTRHFLIRFVLIAVFICSALVGRMLLLPEVPTATGKFFVASGFAFIVGCLLNFALLLASYCGDSAHLDEAPDSENSRLRSGEAS